MLRVSLLVIACARVNPTGYGSFLIGSKRPVLWHKTGGYGGTNLGSCVEHLLISSQRSRAVCAARIVTAGGRTHGLNDRRYIR